MSLMHAFSRAKYHVKENLQRNLSKKTIERIKTLLAYLKLFIDIPLLTAKVYFTNPRGTVLLCYDSPASVGGTELQIILIAEQLKKMGLRPLVVTMGKLRAQRTSEFFLRLKQMGGIGHLHLGNVGLIKHTLCEKYRTVLLKRLQASICHCFNPLSTRLASSAKKAGLKIIYSETGLPCKNFWWEPLFPHVNEIDTVLAISTASLSELRGELGYRGPATVIYSLIDPPPVHIRARSPIPGELKIVYFGHMHVHKGVHILFRAFQKLLSIYPNAYLTFIGEGASRQDLERQVIHTTMEKHVFFSNFKKNDAIYTHISHFDLMCLPSFSEGMPCSILEAMSIGLAVLSTKVGGIPELIEDEVSGILVPPHNETALAQALARFALDPSFRSHTAENGFRRFNNLFAPHRIIAQLLPLYTQTMT